MYSNEFVGSGGYMEVRLFFVYKKRVRNPNILYELRTNWKSLHTRSFSECQSRVRPELSKVEIQCEILTQKPDELVTNRKHTL